MNCSECRFNMKNRADDSEMLKGKVACKLRSIREHGFSLMRLVYVDHTDKCPYAEPIPAPKKIPILATKKKDFVFGVPKKKTKK